jgi:hypothetical protein
VKTLTSLDPHDHQPAWLTATEYELVEVACTLDGRAAVRNAVIRNGEGYLRQTRELPLYVHPVEPPPAEATPNLPDLRPMAVLVILSWIVIALFVITIVAPLMAVVKGAGIE